MSSLTAQSTMDPRRSKRPFTQPRTGRTWRLFGGQQSAPLDAARIYDPPLSETGQCLAVQRTNVADEVFDTLAENPRGSARPFGSDAGAPSAMGQWQDGNSITFPEVSDRLLSSEKPGPSQDWDDAGRIARPHGSTCPVARCFA